MEITMQTGFHDEAPSHDQFAVLTGTLVHLSTYLQSGCSRSLHVARLLLQRLDEESVADDGIQAFCHLLEETVVTARAAHRPA